MPRRVSGPRQWGQVSSGGGTVVLSVGSATGAGCRVDLAAVAASSCLTCASRGRCLGLSKP